MVERPGGVRRAQKPMLSECSWVEKTIPVLFETPRLLGFRVVLGWRCFLFDIWLYFIDNFNFWKFFVFRAVKLISSVSQNFCRFFGGSGLLTVLPLARPDPTLAAFFCRFCKGSADSATMLQIFLRKNSNHRFFFDPPYATTWIISYS